MKRLLPLLCLSLAVRALAQDDPETERKSFKLAEGFEANLFASEVDGVVKPIQMRWDALGRLWVTGSRTYPQIKPGEEPDDRVLILEDTRHTGRADKVTVFAGGLMIPTGLEVDGDARGAWIGEGPRLWHMRDPEGTGHATEREVVLRGFGTGDAHQNLNSFLWSPSGDLMFCQGLHSFSRVETKSGIVALDEAGFWRFNPRDGRLEGFYGGRSDPQNPWGWVFTDWGQPLLVAGNNGGIFYPLPEMVQGHDQTRAGNIWVDARSRKTSGPDLVETAHLPPEWQGVFLTGGYINNAVWALKINDDGAGYRITDLPPLLTSSDSSFRPVDVKIGPDGAIYLCDWYNPIIGHYQASFRHPDRDKTHGRIWRITYRGRPLVTQPPIVGAADAQLLANLSSPERWTRLQTRRYLSSRPSDGGLVEQIARDPQAPEPLLFEAAAVAASRQEPSPALVERLLAAKTPDARAFAAGLIGRWSAAVPEPMAKLRALAADEHPRVRVAALVAAANLRQPESLALALSTAEKPVDRFLSTALHHAIVGLKPIWLPQLRAGELSLSDGALDFLIRSDATPDTLEALRKIVAGSGLPEDRRLALLETLAEVGTAEDLRLLLHPDEFSTPERQIRELKALEKTFRGHGIKAPALPVVAAPVPAVRAELLRLSALYRVPEALGELKKAAQDGALLDAALDGFASYGGPEAIDALRGLSTPPASLETRVKAIGALATLDLPDAAHRAAQLLALEEGSTQAPALLAPFLARKDGPKALAQALTGLQLSPAAGTAALAYLQKSGRSDEPLVTVLKNGATATQRATPAYIAQMVHDVGAAGDAKHGDELFHSPRLVCTACHAIGGQGGTIGPSLDAIGSGQPLDFIIGAVLEPQKEVKEGYEAVEITTRDGQVRQGYRIRETPEALVLRDLAANQEVRLPPAEITQRRELGSLMPAGLIDGLTHAEQRDLFRYLSGLGKPK